MAIDTAQKRASALHMPLPFPDTTITQSDRQQILWQYSGILTEPLIPTVPMRVYDAKTRVFIFPATTRGPFVT